MAHAQEVRAPTPAPARPRRVAISALAREAEPTARRTAASQAATRAVALCSGLWDGGRTVEQINADNGGVGGTEAMQTTIDVRSQDRVDQVLSCHAAAYRRMAASARLRAVTDWCDRRSHTLAAPKSPLTFVRPNLDARDSPTGDQKAMKRLSKAEQKALDAIVERGFDATTYGGRTWGIIVVKDGRCR